jgi:hypothetical protein
MALNITTRETSGGSNLVPTEQASEIISAVPATSAALTMFRHVPMSRLQDRVPVLSALPEAYFLNGEATSEVGSGRKQTTAVNWKGRILQAEEIAVIVPVPENLMADSQYDILGEMTPLIASAIGRKLDAAIFFGQEAPASYGEPIIPEAIAKGNIVTAGTAAQSEGALAADVANLIGVVETEGFDVDGAIANTKMRQRVRNARMTTGQELSEIQVDEWYGQPVKYALRGQWPVSSGTFKGTTVEGSAKVGSISSTALLGDGDAVSGAGIPAKTYIKEVNSGTEITLSQNATAAGSGVTITPAVPSAVVGDFQQGILGVRQDLTYKILTEATLTDGAGKVTLSLAEQDAVALRVVARFGYATANVVTYDNPNESTRWPFGVLMN